jgi:methionyl-tRNA synthetase
VPTGAATILDLLGADARDHAAIDDDGWYATQVASGFRLAAPTPAFPRLELPAEVA